MHCAFSVISLLMGLYFGHARAQLSETFYEQTCPNLETIVTQTVTAQFQSNFATGPATLRLLFHDCFVRGCDASVLIDSTSTNTAEKDATENLTLNPAGTNTVVAAKAAVEAVCPNLVSCADILALATRDVVGLTGGPSYSVELGRRDGLVSLASEVAANIPAPTFDLDQLNDFFSVKGLSQIDMIALSGAHTIGVSHCSGFSNRLYNFSSSNQVDPTLDSSYAAQLQQECPVNADSSIFVSMDPQTPTQFDNVYYQLLQSSEGLFSSDEILFTDSRSSSTVNSFAASADSFQTAFVTAITNMGRVGVKTGSDGEIRVDCTAFNS